MIKKIPEEFLEKGFKYPESYTKISSGYEQRRTYEDLWEWLQEAVNEFIELNR